LSVLTTVAAFGLLTVAAGPGTSMAAPSAPSGTTISTKTTSLGLIAVGASHRSVYLFTKDTKGHSACGPTCRKTWPRVMTAGAPQAGSGIKQSRLGQTSAHQVTYYGHPLYYYVGDHRTAGSTKGQGRSEFGGHWWVVSPNGAAGTGTTLTLHATPEGQALAGPPGHARTLYMLSSDTKTHTTCTGACAPSWPPLITTGRPHAGSGVTASLISTFVRTDGTRQVTYNGHPVYYFAGDSGVGQDNGQCLYEGPGTWHMGDSAGHPIKTGSACPSGGASACTPRPGDGVVSTATKAGVGTVIVDSLGCTLYEYTGDAQNAATSTCTGGCATAWPPMHASGAPTAQGSAQQGLLGQTPSGQVTYNGHLLYYYASDSSPSAANGEGGAEYVPPHYYYFYALHANGTQA
jgi:predicted lipoprotein with Yx(FWY)xxD motif